MTDRNGIFAGDDPFDLARLWMKEAQSVELNDPSAAALATVDSLGRPNVRMVLLKGIEVDGFVFYTNLGSRKAQEIRATSAAALVIHWKSLRRQIRVRGRTESVDDASADAYFASRSRASRIGAWASRQSRPLSSRTVLTDRAREFAKTLGDDPPRPEFWGGFRVVPFEIEFWANGDHRLHDRFRWSRDDDGNSGAWSVSRLNP